MRTQIDLTNSFQQWLSYTRMLPFLIAVLLLPPLSQAAPLQELRPRPQVLKPTRVQLMPYHRADVIRVKFHDDVSVRERNGALTDLGSGALNVAADVLNVLADAQWRPLVDIGDEKLEILRSNAQARLGRHLADLRVWFHVWLPAGINAAQAIDSLNALDCIELAEPVQDAVPATPPPYGSIQHYLNSGPVGLGAFATWEHHNIAGSTISPIIDIEFGYDSHQDLPSINQIGPPGDAATQNERHHGTASLGVLAARANGWGTTGIAPNSWIGFAAVRVGGIVNIPQAIIYATDWTGITGAIILIEQQLAGPAACGNPCVPLGLPPCDCSAGSAWVPVEWDLATYNAILYAVGNGKVVIEPTGNGAQDLDDPIYSSGNNGHWPFLPQNDSGAIMVGAGRGWDYTDALGSRICCSNYGSRVDVQGHGTAVKTTGYGDMYNTEGLNLYYTASFAGTSSASACVAGVASLVQAAYYAANSGPQGPAWLTSPAMRQLLVNSGSPQQPAVTFPYFPVSQNIGPLPEASMAIAMATGACVPLYNTAIGTPGLNNAVEDLISFDDGSGVGIRLFAGGSFLNAGGDPNADYAAVWNGTSWSAIGSGAGVGVVYDFEVVDDGSGAKLYAGGNGVAVWNGQTWSAVGGGFDAQVHALAVFNGSLYAGGAFTNAGGTSANRIAQWNGNSWVALGTGINGWVYDLGVYNHGSGAALYVGGSFTSAGGVTAYSLARWSGTQWTDVGAVNIPGDIYALAEFDDGSGNQLYVGGQFEMYNGAPGRNIARWNGAQWSPVGSALYNGVWGNVLTMTSFDDGTGNALIIGGSFELAEDAWTSKVVKWDGTRFWPLADGVTLGSNTAVRASAVYGGSASVGPSLFIGGNFTTAYDLPTTNIVRWGGCSPPAQPCTADITGDGFVSVNDLLAVIAAWGVCPGCPADIDGDGAVNVYDLLAVISAWGPCP